MLAATWPGAPSVTFVPWTIVPPADWTSELNQTDDALVLGALDLDQRLEVGRLRDQAVPRVGRLVDLVLAVPEQLRVGVRGRRVQLALVGRGRQRAGKRALPHLRRKRGRPLLDPSGRCELGGPDDVHAGDVDRRVLRRQAPDERLALLIGLVRQRIQRDLELAVRLVGAALGRVLEGARRLVEDPDVDVRGTGRELPPHAASPNAAAAMQPPMTAGLRILHRGPSPTA